MMRQRLATSCLKDLRAEHLIVFAVAALALEARPSSQPVARGLLISNQLVFAFGASPPALIAETRATISPEPFP